MSIAKEFETVDLILNSNAETLGVDAFALSLIKAERQIRKLFTHLVYQFPCFGPNDVGTLRGILSSNRGVYFDGFVAGFDALYPRSISDLIGSDYVRLKAKIDTSISYRNKIFHGQLTGHYLSRRELIDLVADIRAWSTFLASGATAEFACDGFTRNSFQKSAKPDLWKNYRVRFATPADYGAFIQKYMER